MSTDEETSCEFVLKPNQLVLSCSTGSTSSEGHEDCKCHGLAFQLEEEHDLSHTLWEAVPRPHPIYRTQPLLEHMLLLMVGCGMLNPEVRTALKGCLQAVLAGKLAHIKFRPLEKVQAVQLAKSVNWHVFNYANDGLHCKEFGEWLPLFVYFLNYKVSQPAKGLAWYDRHNTIWSFSSQSSAFTPRCCMPLYIKPDSSDDVSQR